MIFHLDFDSTPLFKSVHKILRPGRNPDGFLKLEQIPDQFFWMTEVGRKKQKKVSFPLRDVFIWFRYFPIITRD